MLLTQALDARADSVGPIRWLKNIHGRIDGFARVLFGVDAQTHELGTWRQPWVCLALLVSGAAIALFRLPPRSWNILWAEDGATFVGGAYSGDPLVMFQPYSGYLHLAPRLTAEVAALVAPLEWVPLAVTVAAAILTGAIAVAVYLFARERIQSTWIALILWLQVVLLPVAGGEVADSIANTHWYLTFAAFWAVLVIPRARSLIVLQSVIVGLAILSDPLTLVLLAPLILVRVLGVRGASTVTWVYLAAGAIQGTVTIIGTVVDQSRTWASSLPTLGSLFDIYASRVALGSVVGITATPQVVGGFGRTAFIVIILIAAGVVITVVILDARRRLLIAVLAAASLMLSLLVFTLQWDGIHAAGPLGLHVGDRYMVVPTLLLFSAWCVAVDSLASRLRATRWAWTPAVALILVVATVGITDYRVWNVREGATEWPVALEHAADYCRAGAPMREYARPTIAPDFIPGPAISCALLVGTSR